MASLCGRCDAAALSILGTTWHRVDAVAAARSREDAIAATSCVDSLADHVGAIDKFKFHEDAASDMDTGKSFCASPGTGMGQGPVGTPRRPTHLFRPP